MLADCAWGKEMFQTVENIKLWCERGGDPVSTPHKN